MAFSPRNLLLFAALAGAALVTGMLASVDDEERVQTAAMPVASQAYYLKGAKLYGVNDDGQIFYTLHAEHVEQQANDDKFELQQMSVEYTPETNVLWDISAARGQADMANGLLELDEDVRLVYAPNPEQEEIRIETRRLRLHPDEFFVTSNEPVTVTRGGSRMISDTLELDLNRDAFSLGFTRFIGLTLLAAGALAQDANGGRYEWSCDQLSGSLLDDEEICVGFSFSDGTYSVFAGLAASSSGLQFQSSLVRMSEDISLAFGTTQVEATEALFEFEADEPVFAELKGSPGRPVTMTDYIEERDMAVSGTAETIAYDNRSGTLSLLGRATLTVGENQYMGCNWIYNFNDKTYDAGTTDDCSGVTVLLSVPEESDDTEGQPGPP
jgi:LPS export ABC transporter protein LptC